MRTLTHHANRRDFIWIAAITFFVFFIDQATKAWAVWRLKAQAPITVIPDFFYLAYGENTGIAFGLFQDHGGWLHVVTPVAFALLMYLIYKQFAEVAMDRVYLLIFGFLIGGALGNIVDRMRMGYVVDFLDFHFGSYHFPTFNIADSALTCGQALLIIKLLFFEQHSSQNEETAEEASSTESTKTDPPCTPS